jgi:hypothetical protein
MPDFGSPVAQDVNINPSKGIQTLSDLMGLQKTQIGIQQAQQALQTGAIDQQSKALGLQTSQALQPSVIQQGQAAAATAATGAKQSAFNLTKDQAHTAFDAASPLAISPDILKAAQDDANQAGQDTLNGNYKTTMRLLTQARQRAIDGGVPPEVAETMFSRFISQADHPQQLLGDLRNIANMRGGPGTAAGVINTPQQLVQTGQNLQPVQMQPGAPAGPIPGQIAAPIPMSMSPGEAASQVSGPPGPGGSPTAISKAQFAARGPNAGPMLVGNPIGMEQAVSGVQAPPIQHWAELSNAAAHSQTMEGIASNIRALAPKAITGTGQDRLALYNGIVSQFGGQQATDAKNATDLLQKNMSMLTSLGPAGTDAARVLSESANPHATMSEQAIMDSASQVAGQARMARALQKHFAPLVGNWSKYQQDMVNVNQGADPRIYQYLGMTQPERKQYIQSLGPEGQKLIQSTKTLEKTIGPLQ